MRQEWNRGEKEIKEFVCRMHEFQLRQIPPQEILENRYSLSEVFFYKMENLIRQQERKAKARKIRRGIAAAAAVFLLLFTLSNPQYIADAADKAIQWFSDHMSFQFKVDTEVNKIPRYEMQYVPEGYGLVTDEYYPGMGVIEYYNEKGDCISLVYGVIDGALNVDNENKEFSVIEKNNGETIYYLKAHLEGDESSLVWVSSDETTKFNVMGVLPEDELLAIQEGIQISEEKN